MSFIIEGLSPGQFQPYFGMSASELAGHRARKFVVNAKPGFPCRVSLEDAEIGETVILVNYEHQSADSPFNSRHAIYVRENARKPVTTANEIPAMFLSRLVSIRAFDSEHFLAGADVVKGTELEQAIPAMLGRTGTEYIHLHNAMPGCFLAKVTKLQARIQGNPVPEK